MFVAAPPLLGWMLLGATHAQTLGPSAAVAFLVALTVAPLALLVLRDGALLNALERERQRRADELAASANELREQLTRQAAELARESAERAKAEEAAYRAQRLEAVGQLTGGIAHDFNNLLMGIGGNLQLLERRLDESHPARRYLENAQLAADRGAKVTAQLLAFSRTQKLNVRPIEVDPVLRRSRDLVGNALGPNIDFNLSLHALGDWAMSDGDQLELAILNLALNARDAMPDGGSLTLESRPCRRPLVAGSQEADYLLVELSDTGVGMSPEIVAQAVEPFFTTKERGKGTGLGLAQVYGFLRQCGGDLEIDSQPGKGTVVSLLFPRTVAGAETESLRPQPLNQKAAAGGNGRRLVVIDDDDSVRAVIVDALRAAGFEVSEADNGADGLRLLEQDDPVAAIIDFIMPGLNGAEVGRRAQIRRPGLPIIFVSGYFDTLALDSISGATVLRKPFDVDELTNAVKDALHA
jgi:signal transduction histidine kinase